MARRPADLENSGSLSPYKDKIQDDDVLEKSYDKRDGAKGL